MLTLCFGFLFVISFIGEAELAATCDPDEFPCNDGSCVEKDRWCDSKIDCDDDSDEMYCSLRSIFISNPNRCNETLFFLCHDGQCIPAVGRCDGYSSCYDNSDEENCDAAIKVSITTPLPMNKSTERSFSALNMKDPKRSKSLYAHENLMQADSVTRMEIIEGSDFSVSESSNTPEKNSPTPVIKQTDHHTNQTNKKYGVNSRPSFNHQQALEFHEVINLLNASRNEHISTESNVKLEPQQNSLLPNKNSSEEHDAKYKLELTSEISNNQSAETNHLKSSKATQGDASMKYRIEDENLERGYVILNPRDFRKATERALQWLIYSRGKDYGWADETSRALTALYMADYSVGKTNEKMLMTKQLHIKLFTSLSRDKTKRITLGDFALYVNALSASCNNPKNFYGYDMINALRQRTNAAQESSEFISPLVYLVLCLNNATTHTDVKKIQEMLYNSKISKIDSEAVMSLTATCISKNPKFSTIGIEKTASKKLLSKITAGGLPGNIYELALITQALNEARINQDLWNRTEAMHRITDLQESDGSFGDILSTYYALPALSGRSLLWIGKNCPNKDSGFIPLEVLKNGKDEKIFVHYTLHLGNPIEMSQSLKIHVQKNASFIDVMRIAATINPVYKFKYDVCDGKAFVYSIGGIANDAERGLYWAPYTTENSTKKLIPFEGDIRNFILSPGESVSFWMKSIS